LGSKKDNESLNNCVCAVVLQSSHFWCRFVGFTDVDAVKKAVSWFDGKSLHGQRIRVEATHMTREWIKPSDSEALSTPNLNGLKKQFYVLEIKL